MDEALIIWTKTKTTRIHQQNCAEARSVTDNGPLGNTLVCFSTSAVSFFFFFFFFLM